MAKKKKQEPDYAAELQKSFERWEHLRVEGGSDPLWSDGSNMHLVRNHIIIGKRNIEENIAPKQYPKIYYRETPPEVSMDYMARADEIRANAKKTLETYKADPDYQFLCRQVTRMTEKQKKQTSIVNVIGYVTGLEDAINKGDLITMRRHEDASRYSDSFSSCAGRVSSLEPPENEQMMMFADYSDDNDYEDDKELGFEP